MDRLTMEFMLEDIFQEEYPPITQKHERELNDMVVNHLDFYHRLDEEMRFDFVEVCLSEDLVLTSAVP